MSGVKLAVERIEGESNKRWRVFMDGWYAGVVEQTEPEAPGRGPWYLACYFVGTELRLHEEVFKGEFGNVDAVACILENFAV